jgi:hypothetical protein
LSAAYARMNHPRLPCESGFLTLPRTQHKHPAMLVFGGFRKY